MTTTQNRAAASTRAKHLLTHLADHPETTAAQLGHARDLLNRVHNWPATDIQECIQGMEQIVTNVYGEVPDCHCAN